MRNIFNGNGIFFGSKWFLKCCPVLSVVLILSVSAISQAPEDPAVDPNLRVRLAPPPLKLISRQDRERLDRETGVRNRTQLALRIMDERLKAAEALRDTDRMNDLYTELGSFHAIMDDTLDFLENFDQSPRRVLDNFKRLEIGLRRFTPRLELIRRYVPTTHEHYVQSLIRQLRDARTRATDQLYGDTVLPQDDTT
jgi:hypothetical protein